VTVIRDEIRSLLQEIIRCLDISQNGALRLRTVLRRLAKRLNMNVTIRKITILQAGIPLPLLNSWFTIRFL
jgi:hypothetical protein